MSRCEYDTWFVYELIDPRSKVVFYIGKTATPQARLNAHSSSPLSSAYDRIKEIRAAGFEVEMYIIGRFNTEREAFDYEGYLIRKTPGLVNIMWNDHATEEFVRPVLAMEDLIYTNVENQPVPDEDIIIDALAIQLPHIQRQTIKEVIQTKAKLFDVEFEYVGVTDE